MITDLQTALDSKQATLTAGSNITISGSTISSTGGATQAWVTANFLARLILAQSVLLLVYQQQ